MSSRYPLIESPSFCFHPKHLWRDGKEIVVPCGRCDGCLLHKANRWSMRLGNDIENSPNSIFFTLTYNNKYIPYAVPVGDLATGRFIVNHPLNIRFDGTKDVVRKETFDSIFPASPVPITNHSDCNLPYLSKRDIQLWLKSLRKDISLAFKDYDSSQYIRYFIVGEYGPTKYRPHYHGIIICESHEVSEYLIELSLFKNWSMCDKALFDQYTHYCDSGARSYVTQYLTGYSSLPQGYRNKEIKPFRLCSKSPATGCVSFDFEKVFNDVLGRTIEYNRTISRLHEQHILVYPEEVGYRLFPKCYRFGELSFDGLLRVYSRLYTVKRKFPRLDARTTFNRLYPNLHAGDIQAATRCLYWCERLGIVPFVYVYALDMYYYLRQMRVLKMWYQSMNLSMDSFGVLKSYVNFESIVSDYKSGALSSLAIQRYNMFFAPFGFCLSDVDFIPLEKIHDFCKYVPSPAYISNVEDIVSNMEKLPKWNLMTGNSPHIV